MESPSSDDWAIALSTLDAEKLQAFRLLLDSASIVYRLNVEDSGEWLSGPRSVQGHVLVHWADLDRAQDLYSLYDGEVLKRDPYSDVEQPDLADFGVFDDPDEVQEIDTQAPSLPLPTHRKVALVVGSLGALVAITLGASQDWMQPSRPPWWWGLGTIVAVWLIWSLGGIPAAVRARRERQ